MKKALKVLWLPLLLVGIFSASAFAENPTFQALVAWFRGGVYIGQNTQGLARAATSDKITNSRANGANGPAGVLNYQFGSLATVVCANTPVVYAEDAGGPTQDAGQFLNPGDICLVSSDHSNITAYFSDAGNSALATDGGPGITLSCAITPGGVNDGGVATPNGVVIQACNGTAGTLVLVDAGYYWRTFSNQ